MFELPASFGADELAAAMVLTSQPHTPTPHELSDALARLFPNGTAPSVADLVAGGLLSYTIDKQRLRVPPLLLGKVWRGFDLTSSVVARPSVAPPSVEATERDALREAVKIPGADSAVTFIEPDRLFSYFTGPITHTQPRAAITVQQLHAVITNPPNYLREQVSAARTEYETNGKSEKYTVLKTGLDYFTVGGIFTRRRDNALVVASGLLVLDFDQLNGQIGEAQAALLADTALAPALALLFTSPSGDGLKVVLAADPNYSRLTNYERLARYLAGHYGWGITLDMKTAEISRACFLSCDPTAWLAPHYRAASSVIEAPLPLSNS